MTRLSIVERAMLTGEGSIVTRPNFRAELIGSELRIYRGDVLVLTVSGIGEVVVK